MDKDKPYSIRDVEKIPEFALDDAEVRTTKFMAPAATTIPTQPWASISKVPNNVAVRHMMLNRIMVHTAVRERKKLFVEVRSTIVTKPNLFHSGSES